MLEIRTSRVVIPPNKYLPNLSQTSAEPQQNLSRLLAEPQPDVGPLLADY
jgi:hypothetical protein